jgi:hypothetical protein
MSAGRGKTAGSARVNRANDFRLISSRQSDIGPPFFRSRHSRESVKVLSKDRALIGRKPRSAPGAICVICDKFLLICWLNVGAVGHGLRRKFKTMWPQIAGLMPICCFSTDFAFPAQAGGYRFLAYELGVRLGSPFMRKRPEGQATMSPSGVQLLT